MMNTGTVVTCVFVLFYATFPNVAMPTTAQHFVARRWNALALAMAPLVASHLGVGQAATMCVATAVVLAYGDFVAFSSPRK